MSRKDQGRYDLVHTAATQNIDRRRLSTHNEFKFSGAKKATAVPGGRNNKQLQYQRV